MKKVFGPFEPWVKLSGASRDGAFEHSSSLASATWSCSAAGAEFATETDGFKFRNSDCNAAACQTFWIILRCRTDANWPNWGTFSDVSILIFRIEKMHDAKLLQSRVALHYSRGLAFKVFCIRLRRVLWALLLALTRMRYWTLGWN